MKRSILCASISWVFFYLGLWLIDPLFLKGVFSIRQFAGLAALTLFGFFSRWEGGERAEELAEEADEIDVEQPEVRV